MLKVLSVLDLRKNQQEFYNLVLRSKGLNKINTRKYDSLSLLFQYPHANLMRDIKMAEKILCEDNPELSDSLSQFIECVSSSNLNELEEIYTRTFDVQAITTLDIGYVLFGDDYKRGSLLANLNREHTEAGNDCGTELADHLPNVLKLLPRMKDENLRTELVKKIILPALQKINDDFSPKRIEMKNAAYQKHHKTIIENPKKFALVYSSVIQLIINVLQSDFNLTAVAASEYQSDFTNQIINELEINRK